VASLAIIVSLIFLVVLLLGPTTYLLSRFNFVPQFIIWIMGIFCIVIGIWWFFVLPVNIIRFIGLLTAYLGWLAISSKEKGLDNR
jgi:hypothetical protein